MMKPIKKIIPERFEPLRRLYRKRGYNKMSSLIVNKIPVAGKFKIVSAPDHKILHEFNGEGYGDIPFDVAFRKVLAIYEKDGYIMIETAPEH